MDRKLEQAIFNLDSTLKEMDKIKNRIVLNASVSKCFEVALEYAWKFFKRNAEDSGLEVYTPKDAIRAAALSGLIDCPASPGIGNLAL